MTATGTYEKGLFTVPFSLFIKTYTNELTHPSVLDLKCTMQARASPPNKIQKVNYNDN